MKRTHQWARCIATATVRYPSGRRVRLPVIPGILKHPSCEDLPRLLENPRTAHKYTIQALRMASWPILRQFPADWLRERLEEANLPPPRRKALLFLLGGSADSAPEQA
jgi:hypothetical protein